VSILLTTAAVLGLASRGGGMEDYVHGIDAVGAVPEPGATEVVKPVIDEDTHITFLPKVSPGLYYTQVAAGLTVLAAWAAISSFLSKRSK
jgi:hypothetical protein